MGGRNIENEEWRPAPGFEGYYSVSNLGRVKSHSRAVRSATGGLARHQTGRIMSPGKNPDGYLRVGFRIDGKHETRAVHRLVCEAFNGPPNLLHREVHHIDGDRANARADNLRWVSRGENLHYRHLDGRGAGEKNGFAKLTEKKVLEIRTQRGLQPAKRLAPKFGVTVATIIDVWRRRSWKHLPDESRKSSRTQHPTDGYQAQ